MLPRPLRAYLRLSPVLLACASAACGASKQGHAMADTAAAPAAVAAVQATGDRYDDPGETGFYQVAEAPRSTFSIDVDTASYSNVRRFLREGQLPPAAAVRVEEMLNYFRYAYPQPADDAPFSVTTEVGPAPWAPGHQLVRIGLQGKAMAPEEMPPRNLVLLLDVSGSMNSADKLGLLRRGLALLAEQLDERDRVAIVVYAGAAGVVLPPTSGADRPTILAALEQLSAGGSTAGAQGIERAYELARESFDPAGINRVILATDGDFNVGPASDEALVELIERERESGVYLSVLGFGRGNLNDSMMEKLADHGNGNYAYIDSLAEARKVLVTEAGGTLVTIADDVKIQVEMNPARVTSYRLIGYENRRLAERDFDDDGKDAGEIGAGHAVTALYEIVPAPAAGDDELLTVHLRYKRPGTEASVLTTHPVQASDTMLADTSDDFRFAAAVAAFGMLLSGSAHAGDIDYPRVVALAQEALGADADGHRRELVDLVQRAQALASPAAIAR